MIRHGDCLDVMATFEPSSVDAIVTDPPYGLGFMGKAWDKPGSFVERKARLAADGFDGIGGNHHPTSSDDVARTRLSEGVKSQAWHHQWAEAAFRVAKPSAYLLAFGGTRTVHRMACAIEDAGWIIRDMLVWGYASGFPKSKASLKPAWEPIVMARKPGPLRMLNIDDCRIDTPPRTTHTDGNHRTSTTPGWGMAVGDLPTPSGRWPANVILTDPIFDGGGGGVVGGGETTSGDPAGAMRNDLGWFGEGSQPVPLSRYGDTGTYSRFFLIPKAARSDREPVLSGDYHESWCAYVKEGAHCNCPWLPVRARRALEGGRMNPSDPRHGTHRDGAMRRNHHPTVKPVDLMRHLIRLVTPAGGIVLDPFLGSGTTGLAAELEGFDWIGIEKEAEYVAIAEARLNGTQRGMAL